MENRQSCLEISKKAFEENVKEIKKYIGNKVLMPVLKANAYGTYINKNLELIKDFKIVAVAMVSEAIELRKIGFKKEIFVLNEPYIEDIPNILKYKLSVGISSKNFLEALKTYPEKITIHLEIETGMGRTGIDLKDLESFIKLIKNNKNIEVEGVYTHFSVADIDFEFTKEQIRKFEIGVNLVKKEFQNIKYIHSSASNGILNFKEDICNLVRPGIILYGYEPFENAYKKIKLKPVAKLKSKISFLKEVEPGVSISYGRNFIAKEKMKIATIGMGYADGLRRTLSNKGEVVINGKRAKIVGTICMDSFMVDVTDIDIVEEGDEVFIWDNEIITLEEVAKKCDTINYEIISTIQNRVPRKFVD